MEQRLQFAQGDRGSLAARTSLLGSTLSGLHREETATSVMPGGHDHQDDEGAVDVIGVGVQVG